MARYILELAVGSFIILEQLRDGLMVKNIFPKMGERLRLAHEENDQLSITTEIIKYDENLAGVASVRPTLKASRHRALLD